MRRNGKKNQCPMCGGKMISARTTATFDFGQGIFIARKVPATQCSQCGEEWLSDKVAKKLEEMAQEARHKNSQMEVITL
ncbi:type II toxin-antitoxin system MqsA family antitoxin [Candidatus Peregrinibacteria bacterium]|nr:type II toxin-antitoxin system MqsA family antitoxin [Candidatus Peregrinibacteria bacterium]